LSIGRPPDATILQVNTKSELAHFQNRAIATAALAWAARQAILPVPSQANERNLKRGVRMNEFPFLPDHRLGSTSGTAIRRSFGECRPEL
jgi:diketogulonate reductase-like aldo/keto reductase